MCVVAAVYLAGGDAVNIGDDDDNRFCFAIDAGDCDEESFVPSGVLGVGCGEPCTGIGFFDLINTGDLGGIEEAVLLLAAVAAVTVEEVLGLATLLGGAFKDAFSLVLLSKFSIAGD